jgi:hypothetical protein
VTVPTTWTYLTTPFLLAMYGVQVEETGPGREGAHRAYTRRPDRLPILDMLMVSIDISDVSFT